MAEVPIPKNVPADEIVMKKRRESDAASVHSAQELSEPKPKKEKKAKKAKKDSEEAEPEAEAEAEPEVKKAKKDRKKKSEAAPAVADEGEQPETKKSKKSEKKRKRESAAGTEETPAEDVEHPSKKEKKQKKENKGKKDKKSDEPAEDTEATWNVEQLDGGAERQAKMLRLLGGKKKGATAAPSSASGSKAKNSLDSVKAEADLQRQFEDGMRAKNEGGGHRRGLGA